jgi:hypothetical protein
MIRGLGGAVDLNADTPDRMPVVTGLLSEIDLRSASRPAVRLETRAFASKWTQQQRITGVLALVFAIAALVVLLRAPLRSSVSRSRRGLRAAWRAGNATDLVVVSVLLVWWIVAPTFYDDGWFWVMDRVMDDHGAPSLYYDNWGLNQPLGYWIEWLRHGLIGATNEIPVMRLPAVVVLVTTWITCRLCLRLVLDGREAPTTSWVLAGSFLLAALSWGMTLRLEPYVALLAVVCLTTMVSFSREPRLAPLAVAIPAAVLAATAHPAGILAASPLLATLPDLARWLAADWRRRALELASLLGAALALALVLFTLDADLQSRIADGRLLREGAYFHEPWREYVRYVDFDANGGGTAVRRLSLALLLLAIGAWIALGRHVQEKSMALPARSVAIGLLLLALVPTKWPWHFGALIGVGAVAVAVETTRVLRRAERTSTALARPASVLLVLLAVAWWAWRGQGRWSPLDLQRSTWAESFGLTGQRLVDLALLLGMIGVLAVAYLRSERVRSLIARPIWIPRALVAVTFGVIAVTIGVLVRDAATSPWSPTRQSLESLAQRNSCGLAHELDGGRELVRALVDRESTMMVAPSVALYFPCAAIPSVRRGVLDVPQFVAYETRPWPLTEHDGPFAAISDLYEARPSASGARDVHVLAISDRIPGFTRADAERSR